jgi:hypothetical protein
MSDKDISLDWERSFTRCTDNSLDHVVMNYLIAQGFEKEAETFCREANIIVSVNDEASSASLTRRSILRKLIHRSKTDSALQLLNEMDSSLLDRYPELHTDIVVLQFLETLRSSSTNYEEHVMGGACSEILNLVLLQPHAMSRIESILPLLIVDDGNFRALLHCIKMREQVMTKINICFENIDRTSNCNLVQILDEINYLQSQILSELQLPFIDLRQVVGRSPFKTV